MNQFNYVCTSRSGTREYGIGTTSLEVGSEEQTRRLLNSIAKTCVKKQIPWDPFNITLTVRAHTEPKPAIKFYKPSDL